MTVLFNMGIFRPLRPNKKTIFRERVKWLRIISANKGEWS
jgi:hypothetical protein